MHFLSILFPALAVVHALPSSHFSQLRKRATPNPETCSGDCTAIHDPNIIKKDGVYYRFSSCQNIRIATASSIAGPWTYKGKLLDNGTKINVCDDQDIWGPDVTKVGDTYYCYYSVSKIGFQGSDIGVATSKSLDPGTWTDYGSVGIPKSDQYNLIDPHFYREDEKSPVYLHFGSYWMDIFQTRLSSDSLTKYANVAPSNLAYNSTSTPAVWEAPYQFKWTVGSKTYYYLFYSAGECCKQPPNLVRAGDEYRVQVCRAESITGTYFDKSGRNCKTQSGGTKILGSHDDVYAPGGQGVMYDSTIGQPIIYYHYIKPSVGYAADQFYFGFNYLDFSSGWPELVT